ncbi:hypothetical protein O181_068766 [Austropuccinia psidii MF-1]|uniref:Uncharacterized protein n=1 Tax=Austropuccinia psidii MF-1 TaxID=1389203 RepID=A0A9Q3EVG3_9BASI|nr:hypothetical protein [Austropuccinia psidii MF-1]
MKILLRSRDLLDLCGKKIPDDATTSRVNKWAKASYEAIEILTNRVAEKVFCEVVNKEPFPIPTYFGTRSFKNDCRKGTMELESIKIKFPSDLLAFSLLGKLGGDQELQQFVHSLTLNEDLIERPDIILSRLQDYASLYKDRN